MQSIRLGSVAGRSTNWVFTSKPLRRGLATSTPYRTADPAGHAEDHQSHQPAVPHGMPEGYNWGNTRAQRTQPQRTETDDGDLHHYDQQYCCNFNKPPSPNQKGPSTEPLSPPKPPQSSSPRLESTGVNHPVDPTLQQKRRGSATTTTTTTKHSNLDDFSCAGIDGFPSPTEAEGRQRSIEERQEEEREYYKHHKASPLSEIKVVDTRKPITRATDGTADSYYGAARDVVGWLPEQLDTAEEALNRAVEIWKQNAMRGIPEYPHSRVLRALRGEDF